MPALVSLASIVAHPELIILVYVWLPYSLSRGPTGIVWKWSWVLHVWLHGHKCAVFLTRNPRVLRRYSSRGTHLRRLTRRMWWNKQRLLCPRHGLSIVIKIKISSLLKKFASLAATEIVILQNWTISLQWVAVNPSEWRYYRYSRCIPCEGLLLQYCNIRCPSESHFKNKSKSEFKSNFIIQMDVIYERVFREFEFQISFRSISYLVNHTWPMLAK